MSPERVANTFAADLLMLKYLFAPIAGAYPKLNFETVGEIARVSSDFSPPPQPFASSIGVMRQLCLCVIQVQAGNGSCADLTSPSRWFPREPDADSFAFGILHDGWLDDAWSLVGSVLNPGLIAGRLRNTKCTKQTMRTGSDEVLTLVLITDPRMLEEDER